MKLIVPCCGRSSRYPNLPPKWMLPTERGKPMICAALTGLPYDPANLIVTILREHEDRFDVTAGLKSAFGRPIRTCILQHQTSSQSETVAETIRTLSIAEAILIKDSDGSFTTASLDGETGYVCVDSLNNHDAINARGKSYVCIDANRRITTIREKFVISDLFSVGGYYFPSATQFLEYYDRRAKDTTGATPELYVSSVIAAMLDDGLPFEARLVRDYQDWGTLADWRRGVGRRTTLFVALDGFVFERGDEFFRPRFSDVSHYEPAVAALRAVVAAGHRVVFLSVRSSAWRSTTERQLADAGLPVDCVVYDCPPTKWLVLGAPHPSALFRSVDAAEADPSQQRLAELLQEML